MPETIAEGLPLARHVGPGAVLLLNVAVLAGCAATGGSPAITIFTDPGKYQFSTCEQLARHRQHWTTREQELRMLMERAEQGTGGALVNVFAYKADYVAANEELKLLDSAARSKNCDSAASTQSSSAAR
jgi:hypothetical protein